MSKSKIEWTNRTWNPVTGCSKVSSGCQNCYAIREAHRMASNPHPKVSARYSGLTKSATQWTGKVLLHHDRLNDPLKWQKPSMIFVNSMSDLFHEDVPFEFVEKIWITMWNSYFCNRFQILTKRPERMREFIEYFNRRNVHSIYHFLDNVWLGVSCENQETADERITILLTIPAAVRFVSLEPLLSKIDLRYLQPKDPPTEIDALHGTHGVLRPHQGVSEKLDWVIVGGETGSKSRPMHPDWVRSIRDQCVESNVPFFFKQWGDWEISSHENGHYNCNMQTNRSYWVDFLTGKVKKPLSTGMENPYAMVKVNKNRAGRLLDGKEWSQYP